MSDEMRLRLLFITSEDPFYGRHFFAEFLRRYDPDKVCLLGVAIQEPLGLSRRGAFKRVLPFYGLWNMVKLMWLTTYLTLAGFLSKAFRAGRSGDYTLRQVLTGKNVPVIKLGDINSEESLVRLEELQPDLIISMNASQKFDDAVLTLPRLACLNVHSGELPRYRGLFTVFWQLYEGRDYTVPTVHVMNEKLDDGPIVASVRCPIDEADSLYEATIKTKKYATRLTIEVIDKYICGDVTLHPNDSALAKRFTFPGRAESKEFRKMGRRLV